MVTISVIVPVRNEGRFIRQTLECLLRQRYPQDEYEIIVVDGMSEDNTVEQVLALAEVHPVISLYENPKRLSSAARNIGIQAATGKYIIIVDGHCAIPDENYLQRVVANFESSGADTLGRPQPLRTSNPTPFQKAVSAARHSWLGHNPDSANFSAQAKWVEPTNVAVAYRREVFEKIGLFDESFDACEDVDFNTRASQAGLTCYFTPEIQVEYEPRASWKGLLYQMSRYGIGRYRLSCKHHDSLTLAALVPPMWLAWLLGTACIGLFWEPALWLGAGSLALYLGVLFAEAFRQARHLPDVGVWPIVQAFIAIHLGFGLGFWKAAWARLPLATRPAIAPPLKRVTSNTYTPVR